MTPASRARRFLADRRGQFALMSALLMPVAITLTAFAVDVGANHVRKREVQNLTDLAAIAAAANLGRAEEAAARVFGDNGVIDIAVVSAPDEAEEPDEGVAPRSRDLLTVVPGRYDADPSLPAGLRFIPHAEPRNAVEVSYEGPGQRYFAGAFLPDPRVAARAIAASEAGAAFSVGSRLAALDDGIANALLGGLLGTTLSLSVMDYNALLGADVELLAFLDALSTRANLRAGTYQEVLDAQVTMGQIADALHATPGPSGTARDAVSKLRAATGPTGGEKLRLSRLIDIGPHGSTALSAGVSRLSAEIGVLDLLTTSAVLAGRGRQVALDLDKTIPGLLAVKADVAIGEPPQHAPFFRVGTKGGIVRTAQTRLALEVQIEGLGGLLGPIIRLPIYLEIAFAEARLNDVTCPAGPASTRVLMDARPGVADLYLGEVNRSDFRDMTRAPRVERTRLVDMPLVSVRTRAHAQIANPTFRPLAFSALDIDRGTIRQVSTTGMTTSLTQSLLSRLSLEINVIGLGLGLPSGLSATLGRTIGAATPALDIVIDGLLATLGLSVGQADIRVHHAECGRPVLVQ